MTYLVLLWHFTRVYHHSLFRFKGPTPLALPPLGSVTSCVANYSSVCQPSAFHPQTSCAALPHPCQHRARSDVFTLDCGREWQWLVFPWWRICGSSFCVLVELKLLESSVSTGHGLHAWCMCYKCLSTVTWVYSPYLCCVERNWPNKQIYLSVFKACVLIFVFDDIWVSVLSFILQGACMALLKRQDQ